MERLRALGRGRRTLSVAAALLPLISLGFFLGAANLALILTGHPPRENRALWEALLLLSLLADLALLGFDLLILAFFLS